MKYLSWILYPLCIGNFISLTNVIYGHIAIIYLSLFYFLQFLFSSFNTPPFATTVQIPFCEGGAVYSLIYTPHKSWYSWTIQTTVNGVYAFGFLFMLPQLFLNYKLKSVAHLPW